MGNKYKEIKINTGKVVDYIGMTFDFIVAFEGKTRLPSCSGVTCLPQGPTTSTRATLICGGAYSATCAPRIIEASCSAWERA
jgi:hypothetical protein